MNQMTTTNETPDEILHHEFSNEFVQLMKNRVLMSFFKYGYISDAHKHRTTTDLIDSLQKRIDKFREDGNTEWLVDVANYAMIEFMRPGGKFRATSADESPGNIVNGKAHHGRNEDIDTCLSRLREQYVIRQGD